MSTMTSKPESCLADKRAEALLKELGGDAAIEFIAEKTLDFLQSGSSRRAELRKSVASCKLNDLAKQYLLARFDDLEPVEASATTDRESATYARPA